MCAAPISAARTSTAAAPLAPPDPSRPPACTTPPPAAGSTCVSTRVPCCTAPARGLPSEQTAQRAHASAHNTLVTHPCHTPLTAFLPLSSSRSRHTHPHRKRRADVGRQSGPSDRRRLVAIAVVAVGQLVAAARAGAQSGRDRTWSSAEESKSTQAGS